MTRILRALTLAFLLLAAPFLPNPAGSPPMTLAQDIAQIDADTTLLHTIIHGTAAQTVTTEGGMVPTLAKLLADLGAGQSRGSWLTATTYALNDIVLNGGAAYRCIIAHTSGTFATDLTAQKWVLQAGTANQLDILPTGTTTTRTLAARSADTVSVKDFGAVGDGVADDTAAIQAAVNAHLSVYIPAGTYKISGDGVQLRSNNHMFGAGRATILRKSIDTNAYVLYAATQDGIIIENLVVDGNRSYSNDYLNSKFGIYLAACTKCRIQGVMATKALADGIVIEYGSGNIIVGCDANNNNKQGIYLSGAEDCSVVGNASHANGSNSTGGGIAVACAWNCTITGNTVYDNVQSDIIISRGSRYCTVSGNVCSGHLTGQAALSIYCLGEQMGGTLHGFNFGAGTTYYGASDCVIADNIGTKEMRLELLTDSVVHGNEMNANAATYGTWLTGCTRVTLTTNRINGYNSNGIVLSATSKNGTVQTTGCVVRGNEIYQSGGTAAGALSKSGTGNLYELNTLNGQPLESGGTFTPALASDGTQPNITYTEQLGSYSVIGDLVFVRVRITVNAVTATGGGNLLVTGLPFQSLIKEQAFLTVSRLQNMQAAVTAYGLGLGVDSGSAAFYYTTATTGASALFTAAGTIKAGFTFTATGCYRIGAP